MQSGISFLKSPQIALMLWGIAFLQNVNTGFNILALLLELAVFLVI